jgi:hypothetical protein
MILRYAPGIGARRNGPGRDALGFDRRFPARIRIALPAEGLGRQLGDRLARCELRRGQLGDGARGSARGHERRARGLFSRHRAGERLCRPLVRRAPRQNGRRQLPRAVRRAGAAGCGPAPPDAAVDGRHLSKRLTACRCAGSGRASAVKPLRLRSGLDRCRHAAAGDARCVRMEGLALPATGRRLPDHQSTRL